MDKNSITAFVLIGLLFAGWMMYNSYTEKPVPKKAPVTEEVKKSPVTEEKSTTQAKPAIDSLTGQQLNTDSLAKVEKYGTIFSKTDLSEEKIITLETDLIIAKISSKGAAIKEWTLKKYKSHYGSPVQLIWNKEGELFFEFLSKDDKLIDTRNINFNFTNLKSDHITLKGNDSLTLNAVLDLGNGNSITQNIKFYGDKYNFITDAEFAGMENVISREGLRYKWSDGLRYQEKNTIDESNDAVGIIKTKGNYYEVDAANDEPVTDSKTEGISYIGVKNKYFLSAISVEPNFEGKAQIDGTHIKIDNGGVNEKYNMFLELPRKEGKYKYTFNQFLGPLDYDIVKANGLSDAISFGWRWLIRPIGEFFMLPIFKFIHSVIPNFGIAIMIFSLLMKILMHPLSIGQMRSAHKMKMIAPELTAMKEKYKDDKPKQSSEQMRIYSEYGINPMGGCLPMILQMPIMYALWGVLRNSIDLRQSYFFGWITDLSVPDVIFSWGFSVLGLTHLSGLALLMGISMFAQQKMTMAPGGDPNQKTMMYMMPIMFTFMFASFPAGLNLYYFMINLLGIIQQAWINKYSKISLADMKKSPKKEGWLQKKMREAQDLAAAQGKTMPGQHSKGTTNYNQTKSKYTRKK
jgi:YidC/Oxa1 family membrane protein insertase